MAQQKPVGLSDEAWRQALYAQDKIDLEAALRWLSVQWPIQRRVCPICATRNWAVGDDLIRLRSPKLIAKHPCIVVTCSQCGYTIFFNAHVMGIMPKGQQ